MLISTPNQSLLVTTLTNISQGMISVKGLFVKGKYPQQFPSLKCVGMHDFFLVTKVDICFDRLTYDSYD